LDARHASPLSDSLWGFFAWRVTWGALLTFAAWLAWLARFTRLTWLAWLTGILRCLLVGCRVMRGVVVLSRAFFTRCTVTTLAAVTAVTVA
jgi:hypothetical protein